MDNGVGSESMSVHGAYQPPERLSGGALRPTRAVLMEAAVGILQRDNYSAMGLRDLAGSVGVKAASLYAHIDSKDDLAYQAMRHYASWYRRELSALSLTSSGSSLIQDYVDMLANILERDNSLCLGLMLITARNVLSPTVMREVKRFADDSIEWLGIAWAIGLKDGSVAPRLMPSQAAEIIFCSFEGIMALSLTEPSSTQFFRVQAGALLGVLGVKS